MMYVCACVRRCVLVMYMCACVSMCVHVLVCVHMLCVGDNSLDYLGGNVTWQRCGGRCPQVVGTVSWRKQ